LKQIYESNRRRAENRGEENSPRPGEKETGTTKAGDLLKMEPPTSIGRQNGKRGRFYGDLSKNGKDKVVSTNLSLQLSGARKKRDGVK